MLDFSMIFKIGGVGILIAILDKVLKSIGREEYATLSNILGIVLILFMVIQLIGDLFNTIKTMFQL
ncbi:stage III sporulation protein AC [Candidatus Arthromitus sp. SFB-mouse-Japan]|uniref:stage III sporulation protein AC n=1 Tax=unclassified Candidatus Neoarthromitus TaxID=2638829 RepID=UPI00021B7D7A|nr:MULTISPECIES: stage III sporulation protein AC [unclassified Candidatus Arthromitus]EIA21783.1 Stage III sporulation protein AC [Candidatus Arthromitus sp. SFB-2]EIA24536.1 Stage III sporulation protein AC [Candidatus Arthromitus sp. SFB-1]EIA27982.1 Stage III sporulation protein AC [Candidatus Arthromitus sp. SFB-4]EIA28778.1 Stage III sporulation protein AC [Candidatus Arthromitus sp. SFB-co]EIA31010.1 Stage III sporulation protein AC [Candidatus Arthromitus sp. SFB-mouse-SU]